LNRGQIDHVLIGQEKLFPDHTRSLHDHFPINLISTRPISDHFPITSRALAYSIATWLFWRSKIIV